MKTIAKTAIASLGIFVFTACSSNDEPGNGNNENGENNKVELTLSAKQEIALDCQNEFAYNLFENLLRDDENLFVSPMSVSMVLSMISNGATGESYSQILNALGIESENEEDLASLNRLLLSELPSVDKAVNFSLSNSVWLNNDFNAKNTFIQKCENNYDAEIYKTDMYSAQVVDLINNWCNIKTNGLINKFITKAPCCNIAFMNAIYFKGSWTSKFDKSKTKLEAFTNSDGSRSYVNMMHQTGSFEYGEYNGVKVVKLPYGDDAFSMIVAIDKNGGNNSLEAIKNVQLYSVYTDLKLPRFEIENFIEGKMNEALKNIGITNIFEAEKSGLTEITNGIITISQIVQKAIIKVDEDGTKAAAITGALDTSAVGDVTEMHINSPFTFVIKENCTGAVLFMGKVNKL